MLGLFACAATTLLIELLNTRLLSLSTWYHLAFFAVSTAMFGMAAGAMRVYLGGEAFGAERAPVQLTRSATALAIAIPLAHAVVASTPLSLGFDAPALAGLLLVTLALAAPFYFAGVATTLALTRTAAPVGVVYAVDLLGAAAGGAAFAPLLDRLDLTTVVMLSASAAAVAALCFRRAAGLPLGAASAALLGCMLAGALASAVIPGGIDVAYVKGQPTGPQRHALQRWSAQGRVTVERPTEGAPFYWAAAPDAPRGPVTTAYMNIDGIAGTAMTRWDGDLESLEWTEHDITAVAHHLRPAADVAVVGVGAGRDLLTALRARSRSITGIELNRVFLDLLRGPYRSFAGLAERPELELVHDEARAYLAADERRYDIVQMSLIDTWAATTAGAFTLSENGLYTREGFRDLLGALRPDGLLSVSRWHTPTRVSEVNRLLSLAVASLLDLGAREPGAHLALVVRDRVANLLLSPSPLSTADLERLHEVTERFGFELLWPAASGADSLARLGDLRARLARLGLGAAPEPVAPTRPDLITAIASSRSAEALDAAIVDEPYDYSAPTDARPYFFNLLRPGQFLEPPGGGRGVHAAGNFLATQSLTVLWLVSALLAALLVVAPLLRQGLPAMPRAAFAHAALYFAVIGAGFMFVQISLVQRYSVFLGHPSYALPVILSAMVVAAGLGSALSERLEVERSGRLLLVVHLAVPGVLLASIAAIGPVIELGKHEPIAVRCALVASSVGIGSLPLGLCFPIGLRLVRALCQPATAWMWGINGAFGVLGAVSAVALSLARGIDLTLYCAALAYSVLALPSLALRRLGAAR